MLRRLAEISSSSYLHHRLIFILDSVLSNFIITLFEMKWEGEENHGFRRVWAYITAKASLNVPRAISATYIRTYV